MLKSAIEFNTIPPYFSRAASTHYSSYVPIIFMDDECDESLGISLGKCINLEPLPNEADALELARVSCLSMDGAIGYAVRGVEHD